VNKTDLKKKKFNLYRKSDPFSSYDLAGNVIASLFKDKKGKIWIGHWGKGLDIYDRDSGKIEHYSSHLQGKQNIPNDFVHSVMEDSAANIWIGTRDGLVVFREKTGDFIRPSCLKNPVLPDFEGLRIFRMIQDKNGDYWIATQNGLYRVRNQSQPERYHTGAPEGQRISGNLVYTVMEDREGEIWVGTTDGLDRINPVQGGIRHFRKTEGSSNSLSDNFITALCEDHNGDIWIGTSSYVNKYSGKDSVFTYYSKENGLPGNLIYGILQDQSLGLWFATGNGLCRYDFDGDKFHTFSVEDGLQSQEFNLGAFSLSRDGEVFFGGMNGFNSFYPDSLAYNRYIPAMVFSAAFKMMQGAKKYFDLGHGNTIVLNHNDDDFTVEFAGLEFTNPAKNRYMYRLEGGVSDWIDIGIRNFLTFSNLSPGEYTLRVKGSNNDGFWNEEGAVLKIRVHPPWWGSTLAYSGYLLFTFIALFLFIKKREKRHLRERKILEERVSERTRQIELQKTEIMRKNRELSELNISKDKFFSIIAHDLRNPFHAITGLTDLLLMDLAEPGQEKMKKSLENIRGSSQQAYELLENLLLWAGSQTGKLSFNRRTVNLKILVEECVSLVSAQAAKKNITIVTGSMEDVFIPVDVNMMQTVLRNLLTNALKFSHPDGEVQIGLSAGVHDCTFTVKDNGIGIPPEILKTLYSIDKSHKTRGTAQEPGTGLGLILCREFVLQHGGKIEAESTPGIGSEFRVILPLAEK
jgi:signal transduction histidine kinase/streptogramin lyase